jgi:hypothetical protein
MSIQLIHFPSPPMKTPHLSEDSYESISETYPHGRFFSNPMLSKEDLDIRI